MTSSATSSEGPKLARSEVHNRRRDRSTSVDRSEGTKAPGNGLEHSDDTPIDTIKAGRAHRTSRSRSPKSFEHLPLEEMHNCLDEDNGVSNGGITVHTNGHEKQKSVASEAANGRGEEHITVDERSQKGCERRSLPDYPNSRDSRSSKRRPDPSRSRSPGSGRTSDDPSPDHGYPQRAHDGSRSGPGQTSRSASAKLQCDRARKHEDDKDNSQQREHNCEATAASDQEDNGDQHRKMQEGVRDHSDDQHDEDGPEVKGIQGRDRNGDDRADLPRSRSRSRSRSPSRYKDSDKNRHRHRRGEREKENEKKRERKRERKREQERERYQERRGREDAEVGSASHLSGAISCEDPGDCWGGGREAAEEGLGSERRPGGRSGDGHPTLASMASVTHPYTAVVPSAVATISRTITSAPAGAGALAGAPSNAGPSGGLKSEPGSAPVASIRGRSVSTAVQIGPTGGQGGTATAAARPGPGPPPSGRLLVSFSDELDEEGGLGAGAGGSKANASVAGGAGGSGGLAASTARRFIREEAAQRLAIPPRTITTVSSSPSLQPLPLTRSWGPGLAPDTGDALRLGGGMTMVNAAVGGAVGNSVAASYQASPQYGALGTDGSSAAGECEGSPLASTGRSLGRVVFGIASARCARPYMEDRHCIVQSLRPLSSSGQQLNDGVPRCLAAIYDGHNGTRAADTAAGRLHMLLAADAALRSHTGEVGPPAAMAAEEAAIAGALRRCFRRLDDEILAEARADGARDGATALLVMRLSDTLYTAHAGDSRAVLSRRGTALRLTEDHKPNLPRERSRVEAAGGRVDFQRCWRVIVEPREGRLGSGLAVSRSLGDLDFKEPRRFVECEPDVRRVVPMPGDNLVVLASDGLWDVMDDQVAVNTANEALQARQGRAVGTMGLFSGVGAAGPRGAYREEDGRAVAEALLAEAIKRGTADNVTVIVMLLQWD